MAASASNWTEANQRYLVAALAELGAVLRGADAGDVSLAQAESAMPAPPALSALAAIFGLSPFERRILLLCAGVELDAEFAAACAAAQGDARRPQPTFSLALSRLPEPHWSALAPSSPLRRWRLIEVGRGEALTSAPLRIDERILHYLTAVACLDERLQGIADPVIPDREPPRSQAVAAARIRDLWTRTEAGVRPPVVQLCGSDLSGKRSAAAWACSQLAIGLHAMSAAEILSLGGDRDLLALLWSREAALSNSALLVACENLEGTEARAAAAFVERLHGGVMLSTREPLQLARRVSVRVDVPHPTAAEQAEMWRDALGAAGAALNGQVESVTAHFDLGWQSIRATSAEVRGRAGGPDAASLWDACRAQSRPRLDDLAQRIEPSAAWDDLVLPEPQRAILGDILLHVRGRGRVYHDWGFASKGLRGLGITALFSGPSGTGKTMAAEVLAGQLHLDLYRIDLSSVVSKYIGETEKNLRRIFEAAEEGGAILLFDEADALFGKRSQVKDSHDRYANIEVSYLLQRMESYRGLAILTTNRKDALDQAFLRRIRFVVEFPFPDPAHRAEIWKRIFPRETPLDRLDYGKLAALSVPGGSIRNIALNAAFLAADSGGPVTMAHLARAAQVEYAKLERPLTETDVGAWR